MTFTASVTVASPEHRHAHGDRGLPSRARPSWAPRRWGLSGVVSFTTAALGIGSDSTITAVYSGDTNFGTSSASTAETVSQATTSTAIAAAPTSSVYGQSVTFTASVTVVSPGAGTPTGTVAFEEGTTVLNTVTQGASGVGSFTTAAVGIGSDAEVTGRL